MSFESSIEYLKFATSEILHYFISEQFSSNTSRLFNCKIFGSFYNFLAHNLNLPLRNGERDCKTYLNLEEKLASNMKSTEFWLLKEICICLLTSFVPLTSSPIYLTKIKRYGDSTSLISIILTHRLSLLTWSSLGVSLKSKDYEFRT